MAWFGGLFGKKDAQAMEILPSGEVDTEDALAVPGSSVAEARDLINRAAYETLQLNGIPKDWLKFEILTLSDAAKAYFQLQVTIRHWDAYLSLTCRMARKASCGISTLPTCFMRFLPAFCFSSNLRLREISPP